MSLLTVLAVLLIALGVWMLVLISWRSYQRFHLSLDRWDAIAQQVESLLPPLAEEVRRSNRDWQSLTQEVRSSLGRVNRVLEVIERLATTVELLLIAGRAAGTSTVATLGGLWAGLKAAYKTLRRRSGETEKNRKERSL